MYTVVLQTSTYINLTTVTTNANAFKRTCSTEHGKIFTTAKSELFVYRNYRKSLSNSKVKHDFFWCGLGDCSEQHQCFFSWDCQMMQMLVGNLKNIDLLNKEIFLIFIPTLLVSCLRGAVVQ